MAADNRSREKSFVFNFLDRNAVAVATLGDSIFYFGELGMQEVESAKLMTETLENEGFSVERGISGFPTGFCASYGAGDPGGGPPKQDGSLGGAGSRRPASSPRPSHRCPSERG